MMFEHCEYSLMSHYCVEVCVGRMNRSVLLEKRFAKFLFSTSDSLFDQ